MGRIVAPVLIANAFDPAREIRCEILVDTGTAGLVLPTAWRSRLGPPPTVRTVEMETADQRVVTGEVCGPVRIQIEGFDTIFNEVTFGEYEPLLGYIILEQSQAAVDPIGQRLVRVKYYDLK